MKGFEEYLDKMGYSWSDFDNTFEMANLIEQYADEKVSQALSLHNVVVPKGTLCPTCGEDESIEDWQTYYRCKMCDTKF